MTRHRSNFPPGFIPAQENRFYITFFSWYVRLLFGRRFRRVWIRSQYNPDPGQSSLYFLNHHAWWDGLTPLLLNSFHFRQKPRAIMEDRQMHDYPFFSRIGAFSINRQNPRSALFSLNYASEWLNNPGTSLYIFPQGEITDPNDPIEFESGILRIHQLSPGADLVPVTYLISHRRTDRPEMFIRVGSPVQPDAACSRDRQLHQLELVTASELRDLRRDALRDDHAYERLV